MSSIKYREPYKRLEGKNRSSCCCLRISLCCKIVMAVLSVIVFAVVGLFVGFSVSNPLHASCSVQWTFPGMQCDNVKGKIKSQIMKWSDDTNCLKGGEKCLYTLGTETTNELTAKHETPKKHYKDSLTFTFSSSANGCNTQGKSTSDTWYAVLDYGTNYCNLHNLITGSGLSNVTGYTESTSNSICTQYSSADCEKY